MTMDNLTSKARAALVAARDEATERGHQAITPEHIVLGILADHEGLAYPLLTRIQADPVALRNRVTEALDRRPRVHGGAEPGIDRTTSPCLTQPTPTASG